MELDFSRLNEIASPTDQREPASQPVTDRRDPEEEMGLARLDSEKEEYNKLREAYREYQENIKQSEVLQTELLKGTSNGEPVETLLLKACKAISLMTGNASFYEHMEADLLAIYGEGLLESVPLQKELAAVTDRLETLEASLQRDEMPSEERARVERAVTAHRKRRADLQGLIDKSKKEGGKQYGSNSE